MKNDKKDMNSIKNWSWYIWLIFIFIILPITVYLTDLIIPRKKIIN